MEDIRFIMYALVYITMDQMHLSNCDYLFTTLFVGTCVCVIHNSQVLASHRVSLVSHQNDRNHQVVAIRFRFLYLNLQCSIGFCNKAMVQKVRTNSHQDFLY